MTEISQNKADTLTLGHPVDRHICFNIDAFLSGSEQ